MKKSIALTIAVILLISLSCSVAFAKDLSNNNPINKYFDKKFDNAMNTMQINQVSSEYKDAWKAELNHVAGLIKKEYKFKKDKNTVNNYVVLARKLAKNASSLAILNWCDTSQPPGERNRGSGATSAGLGAEARVYKQATINLIQHYKGVSGEKKYKFLFK